LPQDRPQAPGYLANLMARLFHEVSGDGLRPLGIRPHQFPVLAQLWFGAGASRQSLRQSLEMDAVDVDALVEELAADRLITSFPADPAHNLTLTQTAVGARDAAVAAARRANQVAVTALGDDEMAELTKFMNRIIDALQAARRSS
jgi:DNA-binding MarR family transcriptional regulator